MPRIPVYTAGANLQGAPVSPDASPAAFNATPGLGALAESIGQGSQVLGAISAKKKQDIANSWATSSSYKFSTWSEDFLQNEEQKNNVFVAEDYKTAAEKQINEMAKDAPSPEAAKAFRNHALGSIASKYASAKNMGARSMLSIADKTSKESVSSMLQNFRQTIARDPVEANNSLRNNFAMHMDYIESTYGESAPLIASRMRAEAVQNIALGVADTNPAFAREITEKSADLEETSKQVIYRQIDQAEKRTDYTAQASFKLRLNADYTKATMAMTPMQIPSDEEFKVFGDAWEREKVEWGTKIVVHNAAAANYAELRGRNAGYQSQALTKLVENGNDIEVAAAAELARKLAEDAKEQVQDPAGYVMSNNENVAPISILADTAVDEIEANGFKEIAINLSLQYQGYAPEGASPEEAAKYLGLPTGLRRVLTKAQAETHAAILNNTPPNQLVADLKSFEEKFPTPEMAAMAYNDLVTIPGDGKKLKTGIKVAGSIINEDRRAHFLGVMSNQQAVEKLSSETLGNLEKELFGNSAFVAFQQSWNTDNAQRAGELEEFRRSILTYAAFLPGSASQRVNAATKFVIQDNYGFVDVNGQTVSIYKMLPDGTMLTDENIREIDYGMKQKLRSGLENLIAINAAQFPITHPFYDAKGKPMDEAKRIVANAIRNAGSFVNESDGTGVSLYLNSKDPNELPFQVLGPDGKPLIFKFTDLAIPAKVIKQRIGELDLQKMVIEYLGKGAPDL